MTLGREDSNLRARRVADEEVAEVTERQTP